MAGSGHRRQLHDEVIAADDIELIALQVVPVAAVAGQIVELGALEDLDVGDVLVVGGEAAAVGGACGEVVAERADVVGHQLGHKTAGIDADALCGELRTHILGADQQLGDGVDNAVGDAAVIHVLVLGHFDADAFVLGGARGSAADGEEVAALVVGVGVLTLGGKAPAAVLQHGETVQVDAFALTALIGLEQTGHAHGLIVVHDGDARLGTYAIVVAQLVVVYDQALTADSLWQDVVGDELIEDVERVLVVVVEGGGRNDAEQARSFQIGLHVLDGDVGGRLA